MVVVIAILLIIAYPFIFFLLNKEIAFGLNGVCTFSEFMTSWIAFWGVSGASVGIWQVQKRINMQEKQQNDQQSRWEKQDIRQNELRVEQQNQFEKQIEVQQKQLRNNRFSSGIELLGNEKESTRIGGAYTLCFLASESPDDYLVLVCEFLCSHIRILTNDEEYQNRYSKKPSNEIRTIITLLFHKDQKGNLIFNNCIKNLRGAFLPGCNFYNAKLNNVKFRDSTLENALFSRALLTNVSFRGTQLKKIKFWQTDLAGVYFNHANLYDVGFWEAKLSDVNFKDAKIIKADFNKATLDRTNFKNTVLEGFSNEIITSAGGSLKLTSIKDEDILLT